MPAVALGFSVAPVAGQNFGARSRERVVDTFRKAAYMRSRRKRRNGAAIPRRWIALSGRAEPQRR